MKYPWLFVGCKVVCATDDPSAIEPNDADWEPGAKPEVGTVYTVASIGRSFGHTTVTLREIARSPRMIAMGRWGYGAGRFLPLVDASSTVAQLAKLTEPKQKVRA